MIDVERLARLGRTARMQQPTPGLETTIQPSPTELALLQLATNNSECCYKISKGDREKSANAV